MLSGMLIRKKLLYSTLLLTMTLLLLMYCSLRGVYAYRALTKSIGALAIEVRNLWDLQQKVNHLRGHLRPAFMYEMHANQVPNTIVEDRSQFLDDLDWLVQDLYLYEDHIRNLIFESDPHLATSAEELDRIKKIRRQLEQMKLEAQQDLFGLQTEEIDRQLDVLTIKDFGELSVDLTSRMRNFRDEVRLRYHTWMAVIIVSALASLINVAFTFWFFRHSVVQPFKALLNDSRRIASGQFDHRIRLTSKDELGELAVAMNSMTDRFVKIRDNLNEQVRQRTREVVRSEQLASVGFLAAGVAHEINNPLASIAWSAEALESRLHEVLHQVGAGFAGETHLTSSPGQAFDSEQIEVLRTYLKCIQDEAFRCKGITERLLDFSRLGESQQKQQTDIHQAVSDVIALVKHLGQYRHRTIRFRGTPGIQAFISETEFKQVVLNLLTNSLDASQDGDEVRVELEATHAAFVLTVIDHGCGMTQEVLDHLFEPFFTRRRDGRGTGLGMSISYRIVQDHGGTLVPSSEGPGQGSTLVLTLPLNAVNEDEDERRQAA